MQIIILENNKIRLDTYLIEHLNVSRTKIQKYIKDDVVTVNGKTVKNGYLLKENDVIDIKEIEEESMDAIAQDIPLDIVYEDDDLLVINKQNGLVVHPGNGNSDNTLVNALLFHVNNLSDINGEFRPGIVHRIDAYTTGLIMVAKNNEAHSFLAKQLEEKTTHRIYTALVSGVINNETGTIDAPIGRDIRDRKKMSVTSTNSKTAVTHFKVVKRFKEATLIDLKLETGRTHQIRVHMNYIGHPVINDAVYGKNIIDETGQCLHAKELGFIHPKTKEYMQFSSELPECFLNILNSFTDLENK
ncbi:MAG: RluA family pseudouridine synthase [Mycoplasmatota bacterium]